MLLNAFILLFILGIAYWQGIQGFFSALIHLVLVIVSGALAFAFWEPMAMGMLSGMATRFSWTLALIVPFFMYLLVLRFLFDKFVPANVDFSQLTNLIAGGVCGAIAAVLTMGIFVIGISFLPGSSDNFGYRPYTIEPGTGAVVTNNEGGGLWIGVDSIAESFFSSLSAGSFAPANGKSLAYDQPEIVRRAALVRLRGDENTSTIAIPGSVIVLNHYSSPLPVNNIPEIFVENLRKQADQDLPALMKSDKHRLIAIETEWKNQDKNYDGDPRLRVYPTQVQLVTGETGKPDSRPVVRLPIAVSKLTNKATGDREFAVVNGDGVMITSAGSEDTTLTFFFLVPVNHIERYMLVRNLRLLLPGAEKALAQATPDKVTETLGTSLAMGTKATTPGGTTGVGPTTGGKTSVKPEDIIVSADLPMRTSVNLAGGDLEFAARNEVKRGEATVKLPTTPVSNANLVTKMFVPEQQACLRVKLTNAAAKSFYGQVIAAAANLNSMVITDTEGNVWEPHGYVWYQVNSLAMKVRFEPQAPIKAVTQLPIKEMAENDELYVYFLVKKNIRLDKFKIGNLLTTELNRFEVK
jgi:hypothetical protein